MLKISKELYDREALLKASYAFTDEAYLHLDATSESYLVEILPKDNSSSECFEKRFENELIAQQTRKMVSHRTKSIREMIIARALASTVVDTKMPETENDKDYSAEEILKDWFENNE